jgi:hypothetical protein
VQDYECRFVEEVVALLQRRGLGFAEAPVICYQQVVKGSSSSQAEGVVFLENATIILEIDKKSFPSDSMIKYHRALSLGLLRPPIRGDRLIIVQAFITKDIRPLRIDNARHVGKLLERDFGVRYVSVDRPDANITALAKALEEPLLRALSR